MNETTAEALILAINGLGAGVLLFVATVVQKMMDDMDPPAFKRFVNALDKAAMTSAFLVTIATLPIIAAVAYDPANNDPEELRSRRRTLGRANDLRAWITLGSVILMACQFGLREVAVVVAASLLVTPPLLWLARRYIPG